MADFDLKGQGPIMAVAVLFVLIGGLLFAYGVWDVYSRGQNSAAIAVGVVILAFGLLIGKMSS